MILPETFGEDDLSGDRLLRIQSPVIDNHSPAGERPDKSYKLYKFRRE